jgi:hypothetical protein
VQEASIPGQALLHGILVSLILRAGAAGETGRESIAKLLRSKYGLQRQVRELIQLRDAAKERRQVAAGGATSSLAVSGTGVQVPHLCALCGLERCNHI